MSTIKSSAENLTLNADGANNDVIIQSNGSTKAIVTAEGTLGIGTANPTEELHVSSSGHTKILLDSSVGASKAAQLIVKNDAKTYSAGVGTNDSFTIYDETATASRLDITSAGNVGIGTSSPATKLEVYDAHGVSGVNPEITVHNGTGTVKLTASAFTTYANLGTTTNHDLSFRTNGSEAMRILAGGGLTFNGDTAAANALDDYEEGTWTPTTSSGWASLTLSGTGSYTKIGNIVHVMAFVLVNGSGIGSGDIIVGGLPFTNSGNSDYRPAVSVYAYKLYSNVNNYIAGLINSSSTQFYLREGGAITDGSDLGNHFDAGSAFYFQATYRVA